MRVGEGSGALGRAKLPAAVKDEAAGTLTTWRAILRDVVFTARQASCQFIACLAITRPDPTRLHSGKYSSQSVDWPAVGLSASMRRVRLVQAFLTFKNPQTGHALRLDGLFRNAF